MTELVKNGDNVTIHYVGKLKDGTVFDTTAGREPFQFEAGGKGVIEGVSQAVVGMQVGEKRTLEVEPGQAYGNYNDDLLIKIERGKMPQDVEVGDALSDGVNQQQVWYVRELNDEYGVLDGNHPLAGETLLFEIELVAVA